jgi:hypothetical protein
MDDETNWGPHPAGPVTTTCPECGTTHDFGRAQLNRDGATDTRADLDGSGHVLVRDALFQVPDKDATHWNVER